MLGIRHNSTEILGRQVHRTALSALKRTWKKCHKNLTHLIHLDSSWFILIHFDSFWLILIQQLCTSAMCIVWYITCTYLYPIFMSFSWRCFPLLVQIPLRKSENSLAFANAATVTSNPTCLEHGSNTSEWSRRHQILRGGQHESVVITQTKGLCRLYPNKFT
jgi:hypothetical protein